MLKRKWIQDHSSEQQEVKVKEETVEEESKQRVREAVLQTCALSRVDRDFCPGG